MNFRIKDLHNFIEAAQCRTLSQAAELIGMTQPSLSESVKRLESDVGTPLFYRSRLGIKLTPAGRHLYDKGKNIVQDLSELMSSQSLSDKSVQHKIVIGCHSMIGSLILPRVFSKLEEKIPGFHSEIKHDLSRQIQLDVQLGSIDVGLVVSPTPSSDLVIKKCMSDEICVWYSDELKNKNRLICDTNLFQIQSIMKKWKKHPKNIVSSSSLELCALLTHEGIGYGILPEMVVKYMGYPLRKYDAAPSFFDQVYLIYKPTFGKTVLEKTFIETIRLLFNVKS